MTVYFLKHMLANGNEEKIAINNSLTLIACILLPDKRCSLKYIINNYYLVLSPLNTYSTNIVSL